MSAIAPTFVIAEAGVNHNGSLARALSMVECAVAAGADAIKFQTFDAAELVTAATPQCDYQLEAAPANSQLEMLRQLELSDDAHRELAVSCANSGIEFMSTAFHPRGIRFLIDELGVARLKIPSGEITNPLLLATAAATGRPTIVSTGMASIEEIEWALSFFAPEVTDSVPPVTLLQCTTAYPTPYDAVHLRAMDTLAQRFGLPVGLSDHSRGTAVSVAAVARGATVIEKHFTLDRALPGPDHQASLEPDELCRMVAEIRIVEQALGDAEKRPLEEEASNRLLARRRLVAATRIQRGELFSTTNVSLRRASVGLSAVDYWEVLGTVAKRDYAVDEPIG